MTKTILTVANSSENPHQPGITVTLGGTNLFLTVVISFVAILAMFAKSVSIFNAITNNIQDLKDDFDTHAKSEGHEKILDQVKIIQKDFIGFDKKIDLHLQDYQTYKEANLLAYNGTHEKINHTWAKTEKKFTDHQAEIKDIMQFLQKNQSFKIRE